MYLRAPSWLRCYRCGVVLLSELGFYNDNGCRGVKTLGVYPAEELRKSCALPRIKACLGINPSRSTCQDGISCRSLQMRWQSWRSHPAASLASACSDLSAGATPHIVVAINHTRLMRRNLFSRAYMSNMSYVGMSHAPANTSRSRCPRDGVSVPCTTDRGSCHPSSLDWASKNASVKAGS